MKRSTRKFERQILRVRNQVEKAGRKLAYNAIADQYRNFISDSENLPPAQWEEIADSISVRPVVEFFERYYSMSSVFGVMMRDFMLSSVEKKDDINWNNVFSEKLRNILRSKSGKRITSITNTTKKDIKKIIRGVLLDSELQGLGVEAIRDEFIKRVMLSLRVDVAARARAIAQTEIISASNQAQEMGAASTGFEYLKFWSTSGLEDIRDSHTAAETESDVRGGLRPDERFSNGLLYPGDPDGAAEEVINCRCTCLYEIV